MRALLRTGELGRQKLKFYEGHYHYLLNHLGKEDMMANMRNRIAAPPPVSERADALSI